MSSDLGLGFSGAFEVFSSGLEEFDVEDDMSGGDASGFDCRGQYAYHRVNFLPTRNSSILPTKLIPGNGAWMIMHPAVLCVV